MEDFNKMRSKFKTILRELDNVTTVGDENKNRLNLKVMEYGLNMAKFEQFALEIRRKLIEHEIKLYELKEKNEQQPDQINSLKELIDRYRELNGTALVALEFKRFFKAQKCTCQHK